ncbi:hypothetical protein EXA16_16975 [Vibrio cincinnatiensis]|uniref:hypothetical protein n=1 Tax=Vibrio cincinnatiensis TaxID=675 RepID=UPI001EDD5EDF|nr:hypothetical protein [Vibrio cincinnatiensis]MCG3738005.1 hypothetical protein [Vibrio cincinnatiensis]
MRDVTLPKLTFTKWYYWLDRANIENISFPGIYALAITSEDLTGKEVNLEKVVYIGMSNSKSGIRGRLNQLNRSINGGSGHSGGNTIRSQLGWYDKWRDGLDLYVAICPVICDVKKRTLSDLKLMGAVAYMEYEAFSLFKEKKPKIGKPKFNKQ